MGYFACQLDLRGRRVEIRYARARKKNKKKPTKIRTRTHFEKNVLYAKDGKSKSTPKMAKAHVFLEKLLLVILEAFGRFLGVMKAYKRRGGLHCKIIATTTTQLNTCISRLCESEEKDHISRQREREEKAHISTQRERKDQDQDF